MDYSTVRALMLSVFRYFLPLFLKCSFVVLNLRTITFVVKYCCRTAHMHPRDKKAVLFNLVLCLAIEPTVFTIRID